MKTSSFKIHSFLAVVLVIGLLGCRPDPPSTPPLVAPNTTTPATNSSNTTPPIEDIYTEEPAGTESEEPEVDQQESTEEASIEEKEAVILPDPQRILVLLSDAPVLIDVYLWIDGQPYQEALATLVKHVIHEGDTDNDGVSTWEELADNPRVKYGQYGNLSFEKPMERKRLIELYDTNRNGRVDASEVPRLVTRNRGSSQAFSVYRTSFTGKTSRTESYLRELLDVDSDGVLSSTEMQQASQSIFKLDVDDDEIVQPQELMPSNQMLANNQPNMNQPRSSGHPGVFLINEKTQWNQMIFTLERVYNYGAPLNPKELAPENPLSLIDENKNLVISMKELANLAGLDSQFQLEVRLGAREDDEQVVQLKSQSPAETKDMDIVAQNNLVTLRTQKDRISFFISDSAAAGSSASQLDFLFTQFDADKNAYIDAEEFPENGNPLNLSFAAIDSDGDEKLYRKEIETAMQTRDWSTRCQIRLQGVAQQDALFSSVDLNSDGRLSAREVARLSKTLKSFDTNNNGTVDFDELPASNGFQIYRGPDNANNTLLSTPMVETMEVANTQSNRPTWHQGMDYNRDGDVSPREFLGSPNQFEQLDLDADGFISEDEAEKNTTEKS